MSRKTVPLNKTGFHTSAPVEGWDADTRGPVQELKYVRDHKKDLAEWAWATYNKMYHNYLGQDEDGRNSNDRKGDNGGRVWSPDQYILLQKSITLPSQTLHQCILNKLIMFSIW